MKIYIPTLNRSDKIKTHKLLNGLDWKIVVHDPLEKAKYNQLACIPKERILCSLQPRNISIQRNWIIQNCMEDGEWACFLDDNIEEFQVVKDEEYIYDNLEERYPQHFIKNSEDFKKTYRQKASPERLMGLLEELLYKAEEINAGFCGFAQQENYFFSRNKKWKYIQLICSKACIIKKDGLLYDERIHCIDDYYMSCLKMEKYGHVLVNAFVWPKANHNSPGGLGRLSERGDKKIQDCKIMMERWPGLLRYKSRVNSIDYAEIQLRGFGYNFYNKWRKEYGLAKSNG